MLVLGSYVCKFVCLLVGVVMFANVFVSPLVGAMFAIGFVCLLVGGYVIA